jgi:L-rhamnose mutarotase
MEHVSFILKIDPNQVEEYKHRHQKVDLELETKFSEVGIHRYHIFFHDDGTLFAYMEVENFEKAMAALAENPANKRWQLFMADLLQVWEDGNTVKIIKEVYRFSG